MSEYKPIERDVLRHWINEKKDLVLIDVLSEKSYSKRHLPGAKNVGIDEKDFIKKVEEITSDKETPVVVYCSSFDCTASPKAADKLVRAGYKNVFDYEGGVADWQDAGYPFEKNGQLVYE